MTPPDPAPNGQDLDVVELVDAEIVVTPVGGDAPAPSAVHPGDVVRRRPGGVAVQAAVVTTGFVAGAIATAVVGQKVGAVRRRRHARRLPSVVGTQRFLVDVHLLGDR